MKLALALTMLAGFSAGQDVACPAGSKPGDKWCATVGGPSKIFYCNNNHVGVPIVDCPGRCVVSANSGQAYCEYRGWDDTCDANPGSYYRHCEKDGGPSGIRYCENGRNPVLELCDGVCLTNGGHAVCLPEGFNDKCPSGVAEGQSRCDVENGAGKIRQCMPGDRFEVTTTCKDICETFYGRARCIDRV